MPRYIHGQIDWPRLWRDLQAYQDAHELTNTALAKQLHISLSALTLYYQGKRRPASDVFAYIVLMLGRDLRDYVEELPDVA